MHKHRNSFQELPGNAFLMRSSWMILGSLADQVCEYGESH